MRALGSIDRMGDRNHATGERRHHLRRKYLSLGWGEIVAGTVFAAVAAFILSPRLETETDRRAKAPRMGVNPLP